MKMMHVLCAGVVAVAAAGAALAQPGPGGRHHERGEGPHRAAMAVMMLGAADYDGDNTVTRAEVERLQTEEFEFRDRNRDGFLDRSDASPLAQRLAEMRGDGEQGRRGRRGLGREGRLDVDEDRRISRAEFIGRSLPAFDRLDANGDGAVSAEELDAAVEAHQARRGERRQSRMWWRD